jgi:hypothetical protein
MNRKPDVLKQEREELRRVLDFVRSEPHVLSAVVCTTSGAVEVHRDGRLVLRTHRPNGGPT